jgi:Flp pilus assembly protein TadG
MSLLRGEAGESMIATALTLPALTAFLFGLMQVCLAYYTYEMISERAREATRYAVVHGSTCETSAGASCTVTAAEVETYATAAGLPNVVGGTLSATATYPDGDEVPGHRVLVKVSYVFPFKVPFESNRSISMAATSEMTIIM